MRLSTLSLAVAVTASLSALKVDAARLGLAWAADSRWSPRILNGGRLDWYWHWEDGQLSEVSTEFVPCYWGPSKAAKWASRKTEMQRQAAPKAILAFNEPDVPSQSNMSPAAAAKLWMSELAPFQKAGTRVSTPQIVWDQTWLANFFKEVRAQGGEPDFVAIHWYGSWNNLAGLKTYVQQVRTKFNKPIWITEYGVTTGSKPTVEQVRKFHYDATNWIQTQSYIERASSFGTFAVAPDAYATVRNRHFLPDGSLSILGKFYKTGIQG